MVKHLIQLLLSYPAAYCCNDTSQYYNTHTSTDCVKLSMLP
jgi:hypothetical protein